MTSIRLRFLIFSIIISSISFAQKQSNIWYFGANAGLDFNSGTPVALTNGQLNTLEGVASIADNSGSLLFYTEGTTVWDKTHTIMPSGTGLKGHWSSTQSAVIVPKPGSSTIYYVFTVDAQAGDGSFGGNTYGGVAYSEIDMTLNSGNGDITANKNISLITPTLEKLTAVKHCNNTDIWVLCQKFNSADIYAYKITSTGVNLVPIISSVGTVISDFNGDGYNTETIGYMKVDPNGKKIAMAHRDLGKVDLYDFDNSTGVVSNKQTLTLPGYVYGLEFSPDGSRLYTSYYYYDYYNNYWVSYVLQYNMNAGSLAAIQASQTSVGYFDGSLTFAGPIGALQLASDGKIYVAKLNYSNLDAISSPNTLGAGCTYVSASVSLSGKLSKGGLPTFIQSYFTPPSLVLSQTALSNVSCKGASTGTATVGASGGSGSYTYTWSSGSTAQTASGLAAGTYTVTVSDGTGSACASGGGAGTLAFTITEPATGISVTSAGTNTGCTTTTGTVHASPSGGSGSYTYLWSTTATSQTVNSLGVGSYTVTVTDGSGCTKSSVTSVGTAGGPTATASTVTNILCKGAATGSASAGASGGTGAYTYNWSAGGTGQTISAVAANTYTVTITDANGCSSVSTTAITQPATSVSVSSSVTQNVLCFGGNTGVALASGSGGTGTLTYSWSNGSSAATASGLTATGYTVTLKDANGCTTTSAALVTQPVSALSAGISSSQNVMCFGASTGSAVASGSGGSGAYTYTWTNGSGSATNSGLIANPYTVTVTDANGCSQTTNVTITQPATSLAVISGSTTTGCTVNTGTAFVNPTGGTGSYTYLWSNSATGQTANNIGVGSYIVTVTDANGCTGSTTTAVNTAGGPTATIASSTSVLCKGGNTGTANANATGGTGSYTYSWSGSGGSGSSVSGLTAGIYTVTISDANGCSSVSTVNITEPAASVSATAMVFNAMCYNAATGSAVANATGGTGGYSYLWSNSVTSQTNANVVATVYTVTVTDVNGCTGTTTASVSQPLADITPVTGSSPATCGSANGSVYVNVTGGTGTYSYLWSSGSTAQTTANTLAAGSYNVTITDQNSCTKTSAATINNSGAGTATASATGNNNCFGQSNGSATVSMTGGTPGYTYSWLPVGGTGQTATNLPAGIYTVTVVDLNGCLTSSTATITAPTQVSPGGGTIISSTCGKNNGTVVLSPSGGTPGYSYLWSNSATTATVSGLAAANYTVTVTDNNGCTSSTVLAVNNISGPSATISSQTDVLCKGNNTGAATVTGSGGTPVYTYSWSTSTTGSAATGLTAGNYIVTVTDQNGCTATQTISIAEPSSSVSVTATSTNALCGSGNGSATATGAGGTGTLTYSWSNTATTAAISGLTTGNYDVTVTDQNGCTSTTSASVATSGGLALTANVMNSTCSYTSDGIIKINVTGGSPAYTYSWNTGSVLDSIANLADGTYTVTVNDAAGCQSATTVSVTSANPNPKADFNYSPVDPIYTGDALNFTDASTGASSLFWNFGDSISGSNNTSVLTNPSHIYNDAKQYCVLLKATSAAGCVDTTIKCLNVIDKDSIFIPNVFSPNGDGHNDLFIVYTSGMKDFRFEIYDRWGLKIYEGDLPKIEWDGRTEAGMQATDGTYYYIYFGESLKGKQYKGSGFLQLIRSRN